ncbi:MAG: sigma-70 family RNA polymerase sigma factor [Alteromonadales bacterium]|nr:sigma-70 family RNA polymerase sigma factor [Alteromonadales bacterium]
MLYSNPVSSQLSTSKPVACQAVGTLYRQHSSWLQSWLWSRVGCKEHAADLTQDTFVKLLNKPSSLNLREPRAFLKTLAQCSLYDLWRKQDIERQYLASLENSEQSTCISEEERAIMLDKLGQIDAILHALPEIKRQVFLLNQLYEQSYSSIAEQLNISVMSVRRYMKTALLACFQLQNNADF